MSRPKIALLTVATFMLFLDTTVVNVALERLGAEIGGGVSALQWVLDGYTVALTVGLAAAGSLVDRYGAVPVALLGTALFTAASVVCALAPTFEVLLAGRVAQGLGAAVVVPASLSLITVTYPAGPARSRAVAVWSAVSAVALAVGPVVGGVLVHAAGWRSIFWLNVPVGVAVCAGLAWRSVGGPVRTGGARVDGVGVAILGAALLGCAVVVIDRRPPGPAGLVLAAALLVTATMVLLPRGRVRQNAVLPTALVTRVEVAALLGVGGAAFAGLYAFVFLVPLSDQAAFDRTALGTGAAFLPLTVTLFAVGLVAGRLAERFAERTLVGGGLAAMAVGTGVVGAGLDPSAPWRPLALVLVGAGVTLALTPATIALLRFAGADRAGVMTSTSNLVRNVGGVLGVAVAGWALHAGGTSLPRGAQLVDRVGASLTAVAVALAVVAAVFLLACPPALTRRGLAP